MAVWTCVNQEGYERFPFLYGTECTHKTVQTTTNTVKQIFVFLSLASPNTISLSVTYKKRNHILRKIDVRFWPQDNLLKFLHILDVWKHFAFKYICWRHRLNMHCVLKEWLLRGQMADDLRYVCCSVDRHSIVHDHIVVEQLHSFKISNKCCVT